MHSPEPQGLKLGQAAKTIRNLLVGAYPVPEAPNRVYSNPDFLELAAVATARKSSLAEAAEAVPHLPDADTFHLHLHACPAQEVFDAFQATLDGVLGVARALGFLRDAVPVAIDRHNEPWYGADTPWMVGMEKKAGTNWAHAYLTSKRIVDPRVPLDLERLTPLRDQHAALKDSLQRTQDRQTVDRWLLDAGFYTRDDLELLVATGKDFLVAAPQRNKFIRRWADEAYRDRVRVDLNHHVATRLHRVGGDDGPMVLLVFHWEPDAKKPLGEALFVHARPPPPEGQALTPQALDGGAHEYRERWDIETGYRIDEDLRLRSTTNQYPNRLFLTCIVLLLEAFWRIVRHARAQRDPEAPELTLPRFRRLVRGERVPDRRPS